MTYSRVMDEDWIEDQAEVARIVRFLANKRFEEGIRQHEVAAIMHTAQGAVSAIENMRHEIYLTNLMRYARALGYKIVLEAIPLEQQNSTSPEPEQYPSQLS